MAYDEGLAVRIREAMATAPNVIEKKMFGGLCFMTSGHMCCGIVEDTLIARVGPDQYDACMQLAHVRAMDFTGRPLKGMVYVDAEGIAEGEDLSAWIDRCLKYVQALPAK